MRARLDEPAWWYGGGVNGMATWLAPLAAIYGWAAANRYRVGDPLQDAAARHLRRQLHRRRHGQDPAGGVPVRTAAAGRAKAGVLTRGYGGRHAGPHWVSSTDTAGDVGDEALLLANLAPTLVARDRSAGARAIEARGEATVILMDDGLQNPQLAKDLTIAVIDGARALGNRRVIPAGPLRAPLEFQFGLADAILVNAASEGAGEAVAECLRHRFTGPVLRSATVVAGDASWLQGTRVVAWAGIGAPQRFFSMLEALGAELAEAVAFRDHQRLGTGRCRAAAASGPPA